MEIIKYVKQADSLKVLPPYLKQTFQNRFTQNNIGKSEIIKLRNEGIISDRDMEIIKFLYTFTFATVEHIHLLFEVNDSDKSYSMDALRNRMDKLVKDRILNKFILTQFEEEKINKDVYSDALFVYCLDFGGRYLLEQYTNFDVYDWNSTVNMRASELISKNLIVGTFYLKLLKNLGQKLDYVLTNKLFSVQKKGIHIPLTFGIKNLGKTQYFVVDVVRECDYPIHFREKAQKLEMLLATNGWKKYFHDSENVPTLFLIADDDALVYDVAKLMTFSTEVKNFRLTTDTRLMTQELHEAGTFLRYVEEEDKVFGIKTSIFNPEDKQ